MIGLENNLLCNKFIWKDFNVLWLFALCTDKMSLSWLHRLPLAADLQPFLPGYSFLLFIFLHSPQKVFTATRVLDVLNAKVDTLLDDLIPARTITTLMNIGKGGCDVILA